MLNALLLTAAIASGSYCCNGMTAYLGDPAFIASHYNPVPLKWKAKQGAMRSYRTPDGKMSTCFFVPAKPGNTAAIVMVHEWWGLNDYIKREAERFHNEL